MRRVVFLLSGLFFCTLHNLSVTSRLHEAPARSQAGELPRGTSVGGIVEVTDETTADEVHLSTPTPSESPPSPTTGHTAGSAASAPPLTSTHVVSGREYPKDIFSIEERRRGWVVLHISGMLYMFVSLATVCNEFFVPALRVLTDQLSISDDVAAAAFMAAGRSFPKLLASVLGVFLGAHSTAGFGAVVGSAVFNILFLMGVCAVLAREVLRLSCWSLFRDVSFYMFDLILLVLFFLDDVIMWWESAMLVASYAMYVVFIKFNTQLQGLFRTHMNKRNNREAALTVQEPDTDVPSEESGGSKNRSDHCKHTDDERNDGRRKQEEPLSLAWPHTPSKRATYLFLLPVVLPLWLTLPDVRCQKSRKLCVVAFLGSILWMAVFSSCMVWWAHQVSETLRVPMEIMGLSVLAVGTSIPDILTSVTVARKGRADMAVCGALGNNIFTITLGLPVPWLLYSAFHGVDVVAVSSEGMLCSITLLVITLLFFIVSIACCNWRISKMLGVAMLLFYLIFVALSVILQYRLIVCPVDVGIK